MYDFDERSRWHFQVSTSQVFAPVLMRQFGCQRLWVCIFRATDEKPYYKHANSVQGSLQKRCVCTQQDIFVEKMLSVFPTSVRHPANVEIPRRRMARFKVILKGKNAGEGRNLSFHDCFGWEKLQGDLITGIAIPLEMLQWGLLTGIGVLFEMFQ